MITTTTNKKRERPSEFGSHMAALEALRTELESGDLDPVEALAVCRRAEEHYRAVEAILTRVEREIEKMQEGSDSGRGSLR